jgi:hypothetical protein
MDNWPGSGRDSLSESGQSATPGLNGPTRKQARNRTSMERRIGRIARLSLCHTIFTKSMQNIENINENCELHICPWNEFAWQFLGLRISPRGGGSAFIFTWAVALLESRYGRYAIATGPSQPRRQCPQNLRKGRGGRGGLKRAASSRDIPQDNTDLRFLEAEKFEERNRTLLRFEVRRTDPGIPADCMDRLFQPFSQVDASMPLWTTV